MKAGEKILIPAATNTKLVYVREDDGKTKAAIGPTVIAWEVEANFDPEAGELQYYPTPVTLRGTVNFHTALPGMGRIRAVMHADWSVEDDEGNHWPSIDSFRKSLVAA